MPVLICKTFPQYRLEEIEQMDDIGPLLKAANIWGYYQAIQAWKQSGEKRAPRFIAELLQEEAKHGESTWALGDDD